MKRDTFFFENHAENEAGRLVPDLLWFFKKTLYEVKTSVLHLRLNILIALNLAYNKTKLHKTLDYRSRDMLNFYFSEKGLGIVSTTFCV